jgi:hypothetical protein
MDNIDRYYEILELNPGASIEEVKRAYRDLVRVWHPDRFSNDPRLQQKAQEKLKDINEAYEKLQAFLSSHGAGDSRPHSGPRQSRPHAESDETQPGNSESAQAARPQHEGPGASSSASSPGIWAGIQAWLRYEYDLMPRVVKISAVILLLVIIITSTQNSPSKQTAPEHVAPTPKILSEPELSVITPENKTAPKRAATRPTSREAVQKKPIAELQIPLVAQPQAEEHAVSAALPSGSRDRSESLLSNLPPEDQAWVNRSCPKSLGPSLWTSCVRREVSALSRGHPDLSKLKPEDRNWILRTCPTSLGPSLAISCVNRELQALARGLPNLSALRADERAWVQQSCPQSLGPSLYHSCVSREATAITEGRR